MAPLFYRIPVIPMPDGEALWPGITRPLLSETTHITPEVLDPPDRCAIGGAQGGHDVDAVPAEPDRSADPDR